MIHEEQITVNWHSIVNVKKACGSKIQSSKINSNSGSFVVNSSMQKICSLMLCNTRRNVFFFLKRYEMQCPANMGPFSAGKIDKNLELHLLA